tara:strand:- start:42050 stop:42682 length:633 start_codon:yes stop_codon:yes gene_type:complete
MSRKKNTIHYLYKTTCDITNRYYVGMHSTSKLDDGYLGSGKRLRYSIRKHGADNHTKEILEYYNTRELLIEAEVKAITSDMIKDNDCMNLTEGGSGGHGARFLTKEQLSKGGKAAGNIHKERLKTDEEFYQNQVRIGTKSLKDYMDLGKHNHNTFEGKKHSEETKLKMSKPKNKGNANSQFGSCWITNDIENKKIMRGDDIPEGFRLGRT